MGCTCIRSTPKNFNRSFLKYFFQMTLDKIGDQNTISPCCAVICKKKKKICNCLITEHCNEQFSDKFALKFLLNFSNSLLSMLSFSWPVPQSRAAPIIFTLEKSRVITYDGNTCGAEVTLCLQISGMRAAFTS